MRTIPAALATHIAGESTTLAMLFKLTRVDGGELGFTTHDEPLTVDGLTYEPAAGLTASQLSTTASLSVDNLDFTAVFDSEAITREALTFGAYDKASVDIYLVNWSDLTMGAVTLSSGTLGEVSIGDSVFTAELRSLSQNLSSSIGRTVAQECDVHEFADARCGLTKASWSQTVRVDALIDAYREFDTDSGHAVGYFNGGTAYFNNGANAGRSFEIAEHTAGGILRLTYRTPEAVAVGDDIYATVGCDRAFSTCKTRFSNVVNFRGFPHVPGRDVWLATPNAH